MKKVMTLALSLILVLGLGGCSVRFEVRNKKIITITINHTKLWI